MLRLISYLSPSIPSAFFERVAAELRARLGVDTALELETRISGPLAGDRDPFADGSVDLAFVCAPSYRWMRTKDADEVELLPAPVPLDARAGGRPIYFADVVVRNDSRFETFADLHGARWAFNDPNSRSGWFSMVERVAREETTPHAYFGELVQAGSHLRAIELVLDGSVDGAAIDSNALLLRRRADPDLALRVIESWGPYPIQPVIARRSLDAATRQAIADVLLAMPGEVLEEFGFAGFARVNDADY